MFENFPYSNFHDLNADWLINRVKNVETSEANAKASEENAKTSELKASLSDASAQTWALQANNSAKRASEQAQASAQSAAEADNYVTSTRDQVNLLQSRVDNIIPSGTQTEGNTELLDIRVAEDGRIYDSAGNAVRGQVHDLKNAFSQIGKFTSSTVLTSSAWEQGYITPSGEATGASSNAIRTDFVFFKNSLLHLEKAQGSSMKIRLSKYSAAFTSAFIESTDWIKDSDDVYLDGWYRFCATINSSTDITPSDIDSHYTFTLTENGVGKDAEYAKGAVDHYGVNISDSLYWRSGSINPSTQNISPSTTRICTPGNASKYVKIDSKPLYYKVATGYRVYIFFYADTSTPTTYTSTEWLTGEGIIANTNDYARFIFGKVNETTFGLDDFSSALLTVVPVKDTVLWKHETKLWKHETNITNMDARISEVEESLSPSVPSYWESTLNNAIATIKSNQLDTDYTGDSFIFITDTHWPTNAKKSPALIKKILANKEVNINKVLFGGDVLNLHSTQAIAYGYLIDFTSAIMTDAEYFPIAGNHDWNDNVSSTYPDAHLSTAELYSCVFKKTEENAEISKGLYYYYDNPSQKIRYIFLNNAKGASSFDSTQEAWLKARLTELNADWTVLVFAHMYWYGLNENNVPTPIAGGTAVTDAIDSVYDTMNATLAALIVGHCHYDYAITATKGYKIISTTTDNYRLSSTAISPTMTKGTDTEQAFDVYQINTQTRVINIVRIGAGNNRSFTY